ncbi:HEAT repeat domain-containing protein [Occallatibacter savannae]|uniref:HEAT repeat domain-containing protein n=1 Tax=Occallatibacter savannae TaxID=1002691 RepID=UPI000D692ADE|nr:HEAT repeat domain-containing protein [Occallatibacter savannae]
MKANGLFARILIAAVTAAPCLRAEVPMPLVAAFGEGEGGGMADDASLYADGTRAINESRWSDAAGLFDRVAQLHGERADGALYWKAYAENKEGQPASALSTCGELRKKYPRSHWLDECGALEIEIRGKSGQPVSPQAESDENLKLLALNALMQQDQTQAVPILQKILTGNQSEELKSRALFVLAQNHSPQAETLIDQIAQGQSNPALQVKAIRMLAIAKGKGSNDILASIYQKSSDEKVKRAILQSYLMTGDPAKLLEAARTESNPELAKTAVHTLGAMGAASDLLAMYRATNSAQTKEEIISAFIPCGPKGVGPLSEIAKSEQDAQLRRKAIRNLGIAGGMSVAPTLVETYQKNPDAETRRAAAQSLFLANDAHDLVTLARGEKDTAMKEYLVQQLSLMHNEEATKYMMELLNK